MIAETAAKFNEKLCKIKGFCVEAGIQDRAIVCRSGTLRTRRTLVKTAGTDLWAARRSPNGSARINNDPSS